MKPLPVVTLALAVALGAGPAAAQPTPPQTPAPMGPRGSMPMQHKMGMQMMPMHEHPGMATTTPGAGQAGLPTAPGQAAFGAVEEIVRMLQADPKTDWSKVDIDRLRQHLIDMDEVTLHADVTKEPIENGLRLTVTGTGRTLAAIQRMIPAHAQDINGLYGWSVQAETLPNGEAMTVTGTTPADVQKIRGLGFMGILVLGTHQAHHWAMAKGEMTHTH